MTLDTFREEYDCAPISLTELAEVAFAVNDEALSSSAAAFLDAEERFLDALRRAGVSLG